MTEIDYHADVQRELVQALRAAGNRIEENIRLYTSKPDWTYDADWIIKPANVSVTTTVCELKTSIVKKGYDEFDGSEFRRKQFQVLVLANFGGHVMSANSRVKNVGLPVGVPFPPLGVEVIYAIPGQIIYGQHIDPGHPNTAMQMMSEMGVTP